ncbi:MAG: hypothetical protein HOP30_18200 [Cyclobacteriaceae bacterium]|nr:hypothetical protein [Cyclobacteriaceae bacterium]
MSAAELREKIIRSVNKIENESILEEIHSLITVEEQTAVYVLTPSERNAIDEAQNDVDQGNAVSSEKANEMIKGWLEK